MNRNTAAARIASRAATRGIQLPHYKKYNNAKKALSVLLKKDYQRRRKTYIVYSWPNIGSQWTAAVRAQHKIRQVIPTINTNEKYVKKTEGNTIHPLIWKNTSAVNNALKNYFNTHVVPELIGSSSPSLKNVAKKSLAATRNRIQRRKNVKNYISFLEGLFIMRKHNHQRAIGQS